MISELMYKAAPERAVGQYQAAADASYVVDRRTLVSLVGLIACGLPFALLLGAAVWMDCYPDSISHYYYSPAMGAVFVGALAVIGAFLVAYQGQSHRFETRFANVAGLAAFGVALFPTTGTGCAQEGAFTARAIVDVAPVTDTNAVDVLLAKDTAAFELFAQVDLWHYGSAFVLFGFMLWYAVVVFPAVSPHQMTACKTRLTPVKMIRNTIYYLSALGIGLSMIWILAGFLLGSTEGAGDAWQDNNLLFVAEATALLSFGIGWIVHGRVFGTALNDAPPTCETDPG